VEPAGDKRQQRHHLMPEESPEGKTLNFASKTQNNTRASLNTAPSTRAIWQLVRQLRHLSAAWTVAKPLSSAPTSQKAAREEETESKREGRRTLMP
jgi:hypothetical protein